MRSIFLLLALVLGGCSAGKNLVDIGLDVRIQGISTTHPVMVFAQEVSSGKRVSRSFASGSEVKLRLPSGAWSFSFIAWGGSNPLEGQVYCYTTTQTLTGGAVVINATMASTNCNAAVYGDVAQYEAVNGLLPVVLHHCKSVASATSDSSTCEGTARGFHRSYQIGLLEVDELSGGVSTMALESTCISATGDTAEQSTSLRLPIGASSGPFAYSIKGFETADCSGTPSAVTVKGGLVNSSATRAFVSAATSTKLFVQTGGAFQSVKLHEETGGVCDFASAKFPAIALNENAAGGPYVYAGNRDGGGNGYNLFISEDLTENSGAPALDLATNPSGFESPGALVKLGTSAFFTAFANNSFTRKLYQVTGNGAVSDITPSLLGNGTGYGTEAGVRSRLIVLGSKLYFSFKEDAAARQQLCFVESTTGVTNCAVDDFILVDNIIPLAGTTGGIIYTANDPADSNKLKVYYLNESNHVHSQLYNLADNGVSTAFDGRVYTNNGSTYVSILGSPQSRLFHLSGMSLTPILPTLNSSLEPVTWGNKLVFVDGDGIPFAIDYPTVDNLQTFAGFTFNTGGGFLNTRVIASEGDYLYFSTNRGDPAGFVDLYVLRWSTSSITKLTNHAGLSIYSIDSVQLNGEFYFIDSSPGQSWLRKAVGATVTPVAQMSPSILPSSKLQVAGNKIYLYGDTLAAGIEPWVSDGTAAGTLQLADLVAGSGSSYPQFLGSLGDYAFFRFNNRMYRTRGTPASTVLHIGMPSMELFPYSQPIANGILVYFQQYGSPTKSYTMLLRPNP